MKGHLDRLGISPSLSYEGPSLLDALQRWAVETPDRPFLSDEEQTWTWARFDDYTARLAGTFREAGVRYGDRVVLYHNTKLAHVAGYFAAMRLGAIAVHLYPERPWSHVAFAAAHTDAALIFTDRGAPEQVLPCPRLRVDAAPPGGPPLREIWRHPVAYIMFTSGTTAEPKAVVTTQENLLAVTHNLIRAARMRRGDRELIFMPLGSTGGAGHLHAVTLLGNHARVLPWFMADIGSDELEALTAIIAEDRIDGTMATPGMITRLLRDHREALGRCRGLRYLLANVTPMRQEVIADLLRTLPGLRFVTYYGLTEASRSLIQVCRRYPGLEHASGSPPDGVAIRLLRPDPVSGIGEIAIRGPNVVPGYWGGEPAVDAEGWLHTGDWGRRDASGLYFALGRIADTINVDGLKCRPSEIEALIRTHPGVRACAVVALPDPITYHRIGAAVVLDQGADPEASTEAIRSLCADRLARYKLPAIIRVLPSLPRTDLGKIKRREVADLLAAEGGQ